LRRMRCARLVIPTHAGLSAPSRRRKAGTLPAARLAPAYHFKSTELNRPVLERVRIGAQNPTNIGSCSRNLTAAELNCDLVQSALRENP
jgi:hypothetical protein